MQFTRGDCCMVLTALKTSGRFSLPIGFFQGQLARLFPSLLCFSWAGIAYWRELRETEAEEHWHKSYQNTLSTLYFLKIPNSESTSLSKCQFCLLLSLPTGRGPGLLFPTQQIHQLFLLQQKEGSLWGCTSGRAWDGVCHSGSTCPACAVMWCWRGGLYSPSPLMDVL